MRPGFPGPVGRRSGTGDIRFRRGARADLAHGPVLLEALSDPPPQRCGRDSTGIAVARPNRDPAAVTSWTTEAEARVQRARFSQDTGHTATNR